MAISSANETRFCDCSTFFLSLLPSCGGFKFSEFPSSRGTKHDRPLIVRFAIVEVSRVENSILFDFEFPLFYPDLHPFETDWHRDNQYTTRNIVVTISSANETHFCDCSTLYSRCPSCGGFKFPEFQSSRDTKHDHHLISRAARVGVPRLENSILFDFEFPLFCPEFHPFEPDCRHYLCNRHVYILIRLNVATTGCDTAGTTSDLRLLILDARCTDPTMLTSPPPSTLSCHCLHLTCMSESIRPALESFPLFSSEFRNSLFLELLLGCPFGEVVNSCSRDREES